MVWARCSGVEKAGHRYAPVCQARVTLDGFGMADALPDLQVGMEGWNLLDLQPSADNAVHRRCSPSEAASPLLPSRLVSGVFRRPPPCSARTRHTTALTTTPDALPPAASHQPTRTLCCRSDGPKRLRSKRSPCAVLDEGSL